MNSIKEGNAARKGRATQEMADLKLLLKAANPHNNNRKNSEHQNTQRQSRHISPPSSPSEELMRTTEHQTRENERGDRRGRRARREGYPSYFPTLGGTRPDAGQSGPPMWPTRQSGRSRHDLLEAYSWTRDGADHSAPIAMKPHYLCISTDGATSFPKKKMFDLVLGGDLRKMRSYIRHGRDQNTVVRSHATRILKTNF